jgi:hypothetical protein
MAWVTPKTNWAGADGVIATDMNRIEGNIKHIEADDRFMDNSVDISAIDGAGVMAPLGDVLNYIHRALGRAIGGAGNWNTLPPLSITQLAARVADWPLSGSLQIAATIASGSYNDIHAITLPLPAGQSVRLRRAAFRLRAGGGYHSYLRLMVRVEGWQVGANSWISDVNEGVVESDQIILTNTTGVDGTVVVTLAIYNMSTYSNTAMPVSGWSASVYVA